MIIENFKCPTLDQTPHHIQEELDFEPPKCCGNWIKGSGGHRIHDWDKPCGKVATWWHPDDCFADCDEHCPEFDKESYQRLWVMTLCAELNQENL